MPNDTKAVKRINIITALLTVGVIFVCSMLCPYISDDWHFFFVWTYFNPDDQTHRVQSFDDIITSMYNYYNISGGRAIAHFLIYCFQTMSKTVYDLCNAVMYALMCRFLYSITVGISEIKNKWLYPIITLLTFFFALSFGDAALWMSGSINYMWMSVPLLGCISWLINRYDKASVAEKICIIPLFMFSAATNETTGGMLAVAIILFAFFSSRKHFWFLLIYLLVLIPGICFVVLAQGNDVRGQLIEQVNVNAHVVFYTLKGYVLSFRREYYYVHLFILYDLIVCFLVDKTISWKKKLKTYIPYVIAWSNVIALSFACNYNVRPVYFSSLLMIPAFICLCISLYEHRSMQLKYLCYFVIVILVINAVKLILPPYFDAQIEIINGILLMVPAVIAFLLVKKFFDKVNDMLKRIVPIIKKFSGKYLPAAIIVLCVILGKDIYHYKKWSDSYKEFEQFQINLIKRDKLDEASKLYPDMDTNRLVPRESYVVGSVYRVEWLAEYYGADTSALVKKYADTYGHFLEIMAEKKENK